MKRRHILLAGVLAVAIAYAPGASASGATVELHPAEGIYGFSFLVNSAGFTVYEFSKDHMRDKCQRIRGCTTVWPPLMVTEPPTAGPGVEQSLLGTVELRHHGGMQVTYAGHPLYTHPEDPGPGEIYYFGVKEFRGFWYGLTAAGQKI